MAGQIVIEAAWSNDAPAILDLQKLAYQSEALIYGDFSLPPLTETLEDLRAEFVRKLVLKIVVNGTLAGSVRGWQDEDTAYLERLMVHPASQGRGLGTMLVCRFEASFPKARRIELFTGDRSKLNLKLCAGLGYRQYKQEPVRPGLTLIYLEKRRG